MSVQAALVRGRAAARQLMTDTVTVSRAGPPTFDAATGKYTPGLVTVLYAGPADVKNMPVAAAQDQGGDREITTRTYDVRLPWDTAADIRLDDTVTVTATVDPSFAGVQLVVVDVQHGGRRTARHLVAEDRS